MKPFQGERQKALSAHAAKEQTAEYSDDFESDKDGTLNGERELSTFLRVLPFITRSQRILVSQYDLVFQDFIF